MSALSDNLLLGAPAAAAGGISRSLRFNSSDSAYLGRSVSSAGSRTTWTWAGWVKKCRNGAYQSLFTSSRSGFETLLLFDNSDRLYLYNYVGGSFAGRKLSTSVYRDPSAWYHVVSVWDSTNSTAADRCRLYINGIRLTAFDTSTDPGSSEQTQINDAYDHQIGNYVFGGSSYYLNGYLADIHFIDGQALTPSAFGEFDANGIWQPKAYTGTYGTNGFHLDFADNSTAAALGTDTSGNGNNWTPNNLSVTAGAGNDSLVDVPTNGAQTDTGVGGEVRGNYCTWNAIDKSSNVTLSNGNLDTLHGGAGHTKAVGNIYVASGKWYAEFTLATLGGNVPVVGINSVTLSSRDTYVGSETGSFGYSVSALKYSGAAPAGTSYGATFTTGDVIGVALDLDAGTLVFYKNGVSQGTAFTGVSGTYTFAASGIGSSASWVANWGQRPFAYTAPSGFKALCTANLPAPVVTKPSTVMDVKLYTGNGGTQTISGLGFSPDLVWSKARSAAYGHALFDSVRGVNLYLASESTGAESNLSPNGLTAFNANGWTESATGGYNASGTTYAAWCWDAGSSTVTNTQGSITSSVRANASAGFSIVTYTGNGATTTQTIGHGLNVSLGMVIVKARDSGSNDMGWGVSHTSVAAPNYLYLNSTGAAGNSGPGQGQPSVGSGSTFSILAGTVPGTNNFNASGIRYVAYGFAPVAGYSSFGSYTGNGSSDGPFVYTGFRPAFVMMKMSSSTSHWWINDNKRTGSYNVANGLLFPNLSDAESTFANMDFLSNGFKLRAASSDINTSSATYIYAAFAESPFAYARAR